MRERGGREEGEGRERGGRGEGEERERERKMGGGRGREKWEEGSRLLVYERKGIMRMHTHIHTHTHTHTHTPCVLQSAAAVH